MMMGILLVTDEEMKGMKWLEEKAGKNTEWVSIRIFGL